MVPFEHLVFEEEGDAAGKHRQGGASGRRGCLAGEKAWPGFGAVAALLGVVRGAVPGGALIAKVV